MFPGERSLVAQRPVKHVMMKTVRWIKAHPLVSKAVPTAIGFAFGDLLTQYGQHRTRGGASFRLDATKTLQMLLVGATVAGPLGLAILQLPGASPGMIGLKVVADQVAGCIIWQAAYLQICPEYRAGALKFMATLQHAADGQHAVLRKRLQACVPT